MSDWSLIAGRAVVLPAGSPGDSLLVRDGRVVAVGARAELLEMVPDGAAPQIVAHPDGFILPGMRDSHLHPIAYTALLTGASLHAAASLAELQQILADQAAARLGLVTGYHLNEATLAEKRLPQVADLDAAVADRPVLIHRYDGHLAIGNTAALTLAGIGPHTSDPPGGIIDRDPAGMPTGILRETAIDLIAAGCGTDAAVSPEDVASHLRGLAQLGITSIGAMIRSGGGAWAHLGDEAAILAAAAPQIPIRVHAFVTADSLETLEQVAPRLDATPGLLDWAGVKRFGDGSFGSFTAAMFEPFADSPGNVGTMRLNDLDVAMAHAAVAAGRAVAIHAIGDAAAARVLDVFEHLVNEGTEPHRLRLEHASVLAAEDIARIGRLGVVASVQPAFLGSEVDWLEARVGPERLRRTYAFASLRRAGAIVVGGSDSPVEAPDPWEAMALTRDRAGIVPAEALSPAAALEMYTTAAAQALGEPPPLAPGSPADAVIVDRDPLAVSPDELRATEVIATYVAGNVVDVAGCGPWWF